MGKRLEETINILAKQVKETMLQTSGRLDNLETLNKKLIEQSCANQFVVRLKKRIASIEGKMETVIWEDTEIPFLEGQVAALKKELKWVRNNCGKL